MATIKKPAKKMQMMGKTTKAKNGKSFPDLNKDGKITKADILKGRGVIAKEGMKVKKAQEGRKVNPKFEMEMEKLNIAKKLYKDNPGKVYKTAVDSAKARLSRAPKNKMGGKTKKCAYGCK